MNEEHSEIFERMKRGRKYFTIGVCTEDFATTRTSMIISEINLDFVVPREHNRFSFSRDISQEEIKTIIVSEKGFYYFFTDTLDITFKIQDGNIYENFIGRFCFVHYGDNGVPLHTCRLIKEEHISLGLRGNHTLFQISGNQTKAAK